MAAPFSITPVIGTDFNTITLASDIANGKVTDARLGEQRWGSNGRRYVYVQAATTVPAGASTCIVNTTTFLITSAGPGTIYTPPSVGMGVGDRGWVSQASL